ncbi:MAG TPA: tetratricopeptide repeat protein [Pirellulaceae bacterium]|jgi:predicted O-linked N-acetylglucosamine transferase (SPINDLY family)
MTTTSEALSIALRHRQAGELSAAEQIYRQILTAEPNHAEAWHDLGVIASQTGRSNEATEYLTRALQLRPNWPDANFELGGIFKNQKNLEAAEPCYRRAIALKPDFAEAYANLGEVFYQVGKLAEAIDCLRRAADLKPESAEVQNNLGAMLQQQGDLVSAVTSYRRAIERRPNYAVAYFNLANALRDQGKKREAMQAYRSAIALQPELAEAYVNLGNVLADSRRLSEAVTCFQHAIRLKPDLAEAHNSLGTALYEQGQFANAADCYRQAVTLLPDYAEAHSNLGAALKNVGQVDESIAHHRRAVELRPDSSSAHSSLLYTLNYSPNYDAVAIYEECKCWDQRHAEPLRQIIQPFANDRSPDRRLRVGYVSPNFRDHCQAFFTIPLFSSHDHRQFEVFCYSDVLWPDAITERLRSNADVWREVNTLSDEEVAAQIRADGIDILIDLTMHMERRRLLVFARQPAPVQACWLAYPGTTGLATMEYRLTDPFLDPPGLFDHYYAEESVRLPDTFWCYDPLTDQPAINVLPVRSNGYVTFGSLNNYCKINRGVLELWARVMRAVERSKLLFLSPEGLHRQTAFDILADEGVDPGRVTFVSPRPRAQYLELYHHIDIGLDPFPANGHTTSLDAYWMGVPVVTIVGQSALGRAGVSQLNNLGLQHLIASTPDEFVKIATELAGDLEGLASLRATLRSRMRASPLMDAPRFARNIESAYRAMWTRWCGKVH